MAAAGGEDRFDGGRGRCSTTCSGNGEIDTLSLLSVNDSEGDPSAAKRRKAARIVFRPSRVAGRVMQHRSFSI
jgi:hypothetical protein